MTSASAAQHAFLLRIPNLVKLCVLEYVVNVTSLFCPSEMGYYMSLRGPDVYRSLCTNLCDTFRTEVLQDGACDWGRLEQHAGVLVE
eukprot:1303703-Rhodomonas_salina.1